MHRSKAKEATLAVIALFHGLNLSLLSTRFERHQADLPDELGKTEPDNGWQSTAGLPMGTICLKVLIDLPKPVKGDVRSAMEA